MKSLKTASMLIFVVFLLSMVSGVTAADIDIHTKPLPSYDGMLTVKVNETFNITLESNPTTNYICGYGFDQNYFRLLNETYVPDGPVGSGGHEIFTFKALKTGNDPYLTCICIILYKPGELYPISWGITVI